jgi:hypothetical protein
MNHQFFTKLLKTGVKKEFDSETAAFDWLEEKCNDPCIDNYRFAYADEESAKDGYYAKLLKGCCGFADVPIMVGGRQAFIGCNYGH